MRPPCLLLLSLRVCVCVCVAGGRTDRGVRVYACVSPLLIIVHVCVLRSSRDPVHGSSYVCSELGGAYVYQLLSRPRTSHNSEGVCYVLKYVCSSVAVVARVRP